MKLGTKITSAALAGIVLTVSAGLFVQRAVIRRQGIELTHNTMQAAVREAENVRESISALNRRDAFNNAKLMAEFKQSGDLRGSTLYSTIPVVAAWEAIQEVAKQEGYEFRIPKHQARNSKNNPTPEEEKILKALEVDKQAEYFKVDTAHNEIVFARPIVLTADCLQCHGDPKTSKSGDGKDPVGFAMEGWKAGEVHGAFVLKSKLDRLDAVVQAGMTTTLAWVLPLSLLVGVGFVFLNRRVIVDPLNKSIAFIDAASTQTTSASAQVSSASMSLAEGASQQAAALEESSASLEEMSSLTKRNAESAENAKNLANQTRAAADAGAADVSQMSDAMAAIKASGDNVSNIIKTINDIAFQTNILALNAAVEAARAGDAGMGFAVVADEVRSLAQRSAQAAQETAKSIEDSIAKSSHGVAISAKVASSLQEIVRRAREVDDLVNEIANASREQNVGIQQINLAITQMDKVTQSNAASAEESASGAQELRSQAQDLRAAVVELQSLVGGNEMPAPSNGGSRDDARLEKATSQPNSRPPSRAVPVPPARRQNSRTHIGVIGRGPGSPEAAKADFKDF